MTEAEKWKRKDLSLDTDFTLGGGEEDVACVDLDGEWLESSKVFRHSSFTSPEIEFVKGEVGEGGDHINITLKNISDKEFTIAGDVVVCTVDEDPSSEAGGGGGEDQPLTEPQQVEEEESSKSTEDGDKEKQTGVLATKENNEDKPEPMDDEDKEETHEVASKLNTNTENVIESHAPLEDGGAAGREEDEAMEVDGGVNSSSTAVEDSLAGMEDSSNAVEDKSAAEEDKSAAAKEDKSATEDNSAAEEDNSAVIKDSSAAEKDVSTAVEDSTAAVEDSTAAVEDSSAAVEKDACDKDTELPDGQTNQESDTKTADSAAATVPDITAASATSNGNETEEQTDKTAEAVEVAETPAKKPTPPPSMRFVNETEADDKDEEEEEEVDGEEVTVKEDADRAAEKGEETETAEENEASGDSVDEVETKEEKDADEGKNGEEGKKPVLKLASFAGMKEGGKEVKKQAGSSESEEGCGQCHTLLPTLRSGLVWETMQFCDTTCLDHYQGNMSSCSSCKKSVGQGSLGKYCVRFGSEIKQFCSNSCLEDHKKGLKSCFYCQRDLSGGDGFLAPIGDKGQFKDFCKQDCMNKYEIMHMGKAKEEETALCGVCKNNKTVAQEIIRAKEVIKLCSLDSCFSAYKFVNKVETIACTTCSKHFDTTMPKVRTYFEGTVSSFCSKSCQNVHVMANRKISACGLCKVKKYNFDMIEEFPDSSRSTLFCSLICLKSHRAVGGRKDAASSTASSLPVISSISSLCPVMKSAQARLDLPSQPVPHAQLQQQAAKAQLVPTPPLQFQTQTVRELVRETKVLPAQLPAVRNKGMQTKPFMTTKGVSCRPHTTVRSTQTEEPPQPVVVPLPVPIHLPTPVKMYNAPYPVPVPIPLPFPVPIFIPTTRNSMKGIMKQIKKIINKIPADPFEAELLALAGNIAAEDGESSNSESDGEEAGHNNGDLAPSSHTSLHQQPHTDLEQDMTGGRVLPKSLPMSAPDTQETRQFSSKRKAGQRGDNPDDPDTEDETWLPQTGGYEQKQQRRRTRGRSSQSGNKRQKTDSSAREANQQSKERPDLSHHLKFTYGVNAWKNWVMTKNAELERQRAQGKYQKSFETNILKLRADELNFTLCMFVKEVKKPNGENYAGDSILYLVLGIQEFLFENGRIDNIFTDVYYDPFTSALHEVVKDFRLPVNELGYFVTRIEEEHLWESKQLGAHSPQVLLNTLVYFNTKYFQLKTVDQHLKLSFSHIMKHWKKDAVTKTGQQKRTVLLRYYPPPSKGQKPEERRMYEQHENHENPLRCPVKLFEFYLSKCPESTKNRNDVFYLQPERTCVPDSLVWYSIQLLNRFSMEKMLSRLLMVREVQEHMLADQI